MDVLINLLILVIIAGVIFYCIRAFVPEPPRSIALYIFGVICVIYLLLLLVGAAPHFSLK